MASKIVAYGGGFIGAVVVLALAGNAYLAVTRTDETKKQTEVSSQDDLIGRCVAVALDKGYRDATCAFNFLEACVKQQSRSAMDHAYSIDSMYKLKESS